MCLSIAINRPNDVLATGEHKGFEWCVTHNGTGYRCGYVRIPAGHPWHGKHYDDIDARCHGGLTFDEADEPCDKGGPDNAWWIGFDCAHSGDRPDSTLTRNRLDPASKAMLDLGNFAGSMLSLGDVSNLPAGVRSQQYVEAECHSLCEQAEAAQAKSVEAPYGLGGPGSDTYFSMKD